MAFIEPMHRNKPNITYLLTYLQESLHYFHTNKYENFYFAESR